LLDQQLSIQENKGRSPIPSRYDSTSELATVIYTCCKIFQLKTVVETGVARGASTAIILKALNENGIGHLYSVDLPGLSWGYKKHIGELVPKICKVVGLLGLAHKPRSFQTSSGPYYD